MFTGGPFGLGGDETELLRGRSGVYLLIWEKVLQFRFLEVRMCVERARVMKFCRVARFSRMAEAVENSDKGSETDVSKVVSDFVKGLSEEHRMLVVLKAQLYEGSWQPMLDDLRNRLEGKPYIFKLANRVRDDVERIEEMQRFEGEHDIDLADYVDLS